MPSTGTENSDLIDNILNNIIQMLVLSDANHKSGQWKLYPSHIQFLAYFASLQILCFMPGEKVN